MQWTKWILRLLGMVLSFALGLLVIEIALRVGAAEQAGFRSTKVLERAHSGWPRPDFRGLGLPAHKPEGTFRLVVVGDSFTWGDGVYVEDAYPNRMQARLSHWESDLELEVVTLSRLGWNTKLEQRYFRRHFKRLDPDLLILGFVLNDPQLNTNEERREAVALLSRRQPKEPWTKWIYSNSRLYALVYERFENTRQRRAFRSHYDNIFADGPGWRTCIKSLEKFRALTANHSIPMLLVIFPVFDSQMDVYSYGDLHELVAETATSMGIDVLDLLPAYEGLDGRRLAVEPFTDSHPSELAHRIAADRILSHLLDNGLLPAQPEPRREWAQAEPP